MVSGTLPYKDFSEGRINLCIRFLGTMRLGGVLLHSHVTSDTLGITPRPVFWEELNLLKLHEFRLEISSYRRAFDVGLQQTILLSWGIDV